MATLILSSLLPRVGDSPTPSMHCSLTPALLFTSYSTLNRNLLLHHFRGSFRVPSCARLLKSAVRHLPRLSFVRYLCRPSCTAIFTRSISYCASVSSIITAMLCSLFLLTVYQASG
ncbi:hypothetical protein XELAEV_18003714mg [Xenopus laevis]|uniref:Uncharacterized protein n=1 Tax=Xenopus laevis TaxID=8355 RepID=A0A974BQ35_XENLA|nr:hypothetical protein XELAEV_18003714mg [Xenopus laevis]